MGVTHIDSVFQGLVVQLRIRRSELLVQAEVEAASDADRQFLSGLRNLCANRHLHTPVGILTTLPHLA